MVFVLSSENVVRYLQQRSLCSPDQQLAFPIKPDEYRNFNLIVSFTNNQHYLVKQERFDGDDNTSGTLKYEWILQQFLANFPQLNSIQALIAPVINFEPESSILVVKYLPEYISLDRYYHRLGDYPPGIAATLGINLAQIHRLTFQQQKYLDFLRSSSSHFSSIPNFTAGLTKINPEIFAHIGSNGIKFFKLYQRFPRLHQAVVQLQNSYQSTCLTHNDPKFSNYLIEDKLTSSPKIKLIDWEFMDWGDPAYDLGILISKYLELWLNSLPINSDTDLSLSLSLAACPLEKVQPSLIDLLQNYLITFPTIKSTRPDFVHRVLQFAGLALIKQLQHRVECHLPFGNRDVCTLQVAKSLLCNPEKSIQTIFGVGNLCNNLQNNTARSL